MKLNFDVSKEEYVIVQEILRQYIPLGCKVWVVGSRATHGAKHNSDLDLALEDTKKIDTRIIAQLKEAFTQSILPYKVDVLDVHAVQDKFKKIIDGKKVAFPLDQRRSVPTLRFPEFSDEWKETKLGDVCKIRAGGDIDKGDISKIKNNIFQYPIFSNSEKNCGLYGYTKKYTDDENCVTVTGRGSLGKAKARFEKFYAIVRLLVIRPIVDINLIFLEYSINMLNIYTESTGVPQLTAPQLSSYKIKLPSLPEQEKIATFFSAVDEKIACTRKLIEHLNVYKKGMMQKLFSQAIRFKGFNDEWKETKLGDVAEIVGGGTPDTNKPEYWNGSIAWFTPTEIQKKYLKSSKRTISATGLKHSSGKLLPKGTLLFTSRASIGRVALTLVECATNQGFQSFLPSNKLDLEFLYYWMLLHEKKFIRLAKGSTFLEISKTSMQKILINLPTLPEQEKIAGFLSAIDEKIAHTEKQLEGLEQWKKGLMQKMFV